MNQAQTSHAKSVTGHMLRYAETFVRVMKTYSQIEPDYLGWEQFEQNVTLEVEHLKRELDQVLSDMMPIGRDA